MATPRNRNVIRFFRGDFLIPRKTGIKFSKKMQMYGVQCNLQPGDWVILEGEAVFFWWIRVDFWWFPHSKHAEIEVPQLLLCLQTWCLGPQGSVGTAWNPGFFWTARHHPLRPLDAAERSGKGNDCRSFCRGYSSFHGDATSIAFRPHPKSSMLFGFAAPFHHIATKFWIIPVKVKIDCDYRVIWQLYSWSCNCPLLTLFVLVFVGLRNLDELESARLKFLPYFHEIVKTGWFGHGNSPFEPWLSNSSRPALMLRM